MGTSASHSKRVEVQYTPIGSKQEIKLCCNQKDPAEWTWECNGTVSPVTVQEQKLIQLNNCHFIHDHEQVNYIPTDDPLFKFSKEQALHTVLVGDKADLHFVTENRQKFLQVDARHLRILFVHLENGIMRFDRLLGLISTTNNVTYDRQNVCYPRRVYSNAIII